MFGSVRVIIMAVVFIGISGVGVYVMKLRSDNAILQANQIQLELSIESQKQVIQKQKIVNRGSERATRCVEIAGGSPLTEKELLATKKSEINTECPSIANPNYEPY